MTNNELNSAISFINNHKDIVGTDIANKTIKLITKYNGYPDLDDIEYKRVDDFYNKHKEVCRCGNACRLIELYTCGFTYTYVCNICKESYDYTNYDKECWSECDHKKLPFSFIVFNTGIGPCITIICTENHDSEDITDVESW